MKFPKRSEALVTGNVATDILASTLNNFANVISVPVEKDLGIDLICELMESNWPTGIPFYIQCKGMKKSKKKKGFYYIPIKVSTINYWFINKAPVILIVVDLEEEEFFWTYPYDQIKGKWNEIQKYDTVSIKIFEGDSFSFGEKDIPAGIDRIIKEYNFSDSYMKFKEIKHGVSLEVGNVYELYREFKELKSKEKSQLRYAGVTREILQYTLNVREQFSHFFVTSDIRRWRYTANQLCFFLFKKTDNGNCYYIADIIVSLNPDGIWDHMVELSNGAMLDGSSGDINECLEAIVYYLNSIY